MNLPFQNKIRHASHWLQRRFTSKAVILMYHRVTEQSIDPWALNVSLENFREQMEVLKRCARVVALEEMGRSHEVGRIQDQAVAVTFDDGYANNLYQAKPILEQYEIPATVFVTSGYIGSQREFWWDELDYLLLRPGSLPASFSLTLKEGAAFKWVLNGAREYSEKEYRQDFGRGFWEAPPNNSRMAFYGSIWQVLQPLAEEERTIALDLIKSWSDVNPVARATHRPMDSAEIIELVTDGLVNVGAHTVNHPHLPAHSIEFQDQQIRTSKSVIETVIGRPLKTFAYPFGAYQNETAHLVSNAGFDCACSTTEEPVWSGSGRYCLPRFEVQDWSGEEFAKRLFKWFRS